MLAFSAFLIFDVSYRLRICVWYGTRCEDLLSAHAPCAGDAMTHEASVQAVCCRCCGDGSLDVVLDNDQHTNNLVVPISIGSDI